MPNTSRPAFDIWIDARAECADDARSAVGEAGLAAGFAQFLRAAPEGARSGAYLPSAAPAGVDLRGPEGAGERDVHAVRARRRAAGQGVGAEAERGEQRA